MKNFDTSVTVRWLVPSRYGSHYSHAHFESATVAHAVTLAGVKNGAIICLSGVEGPGRAEYVRCIARTPVEENHND